jgi:hypothetical protein
MKMEELFDLTGKTVWKSHLNLNAALSSFYIAEALVCEAKKRNEGFLRSQQAFERKTIENFEELTNQLACIFGSYILQAIAGELRWFICECYNYTHGRSLFSSLPILQEMTLDEKKVYRFCNRKFGRTYWNQPSGNRVSAQMMVLKAFHKKSHSHILDIDEVKEFLEIAKMAFNFDGWDSGGFGGKRWAYAASIILDWIEGKIETPIFVDTVFALRHNGEKFFDKARYFYVLNRTLNQQLNAKARAKIFMALLKSLLNLHRCIDQKTLSLCEQICKIPIRTRSAAAVTPVSLKFPMDELKMDKLKGKGREK